MILNMQLFFHPVLSPQGEKSRACEPGPTRAARYADEPQGPMEGHGSLKQEGQCVGVSRGPKLWRMRV